jgi:hypothetical protein
VREKIDQHKENRASGTYGEWWRKGEEGETQRGQRRREAHATIFFWRETKKSPQHENAVFLFEGKK